MGDVVSTDWGKDHGEGACHEQMGGRTDRNYGT
jgi:hypothetical protein